jgi:hypothetical protein
MSKTLRPALSSPTANALLAAASAGLLAQSASASTYNEASSDASNSLATPTTLPVGTDKVTARMEATPDIRDYFILQNLVANSTVNLDVDWTFFGGVTTFSMFMQNVALEGIAQVNPTFANGSQSFQMTVPPDGKILFSAALNEGGAESGVNYNITVVPEAGTTAAAAAAALAAMLEIRRRRQRAG